MRAPVVFDGRNIYSPRTDAGARLHLLLHRTVTTARSSSPAAPATSAATRRRRWRRRAGGWSSTTTCRRGTAPRCAGAISSMATCTTRRRLRATIRDYREVAPSCTSPRWPRSATRSATRRLLRATTSRAALGLLEAMVARVGPADFVFSSTCGGVRRTRTRRPIARGAPTAADQPVRRDEAGGRAGAAALRARVRPARRRAAVLQRGGRRSRAASSARITARRSHLIPLAIEAAPRRRAAARVRRRLPDARRHLPARLHPRDAISPTRTCCALEALETRRQRRPRTISATGARTP